MHGLIVEIATLTSNPTSAEHDLTGLQETAPSWFSECFRVPRETASVEVDGAAINYYRWGNPDNPGVLLTHGFMAHARCWAFIAPLLADHYCLVAFDLSGMGDSGWRSVYDANTRAKECVAVAEHSGITKQGPPHLVCHSYGAGVGLTAMLHDATLWRSFIACDVTMLAPGEEAQFEEIRKRRESRGIRPHRVSENLSEVRERFRLAPDQPCENDYLLEYMARHSVKPSTDPSAAPNADKEDGYVWKFDPAILGPDSGRDPEWWTQIAPNFANLNAQRAIIYGAHSPMMSPQVLQYINDQSKGTIPIVKIDDAHHHIMLDQPLAFATAINILLQTM